MNDGSEDAVVTSQSAYKQCPQCGFATAVVVQQCPQCGHKYRTQFKPPAEAPKPVSKTTTIGCVTCGNHDVLKLSALDRTTSGGIAPPTRPDYESPQSVMVALVCAGLFLISIIALAVAGFGNTLVLILCGGLAILAVATGLFASQETKSAKQELDAATSRYEEQIKQWNLLFYCPKCDSVYNLITQKAAPLSSANSLLRR